MFIAIPKILLLISFTYLPLIYFFDISVILYVNALFLNISFCEIMPGILLPIIVSGYLYFISNKKLPYLSTICLGLGLGLGLDKSLCIGNIGIAP